MQDSNLDDLFDTLKTELSGLDFAVTTSKIIKSPDKTVIKEILEQILLTMGRLQEVAMEEPLVASALLFRNITQVRTMRTMVESGKLPLDRTEKPS